jgi:hypothetical protein
MTFKVFLSHRWEDRTLAAAIRGHLKFLSDGAIECSVAETIPGGKDWLDWIGSNIQAAELLIFLYTTSDHDWTWCVREIGQFEGTQQARQKSPQIVWFLNEGLEIPTFISNYQSYGVTYREIERMFMDLMVRGAFTADTPLVPNVHIAKVDDFRIAIQQIAKIFANLSRPEEFFRFRLRLSYPDPDKIVDEISKLLLIPRSERASAWLANAKIEASSSTLHIVGSGDGAELSRYLKLPQDDSNLDAWLNDVREYVKQSFPDASPEERAAREQILTPVFTDGRLYLPVIARLEYISGWPSSLVTIFVSAPPFSDDPASMLAQGMPSSLVYCAVLSRLARRFRWAFLEPVVNALPPDGTEQGHNLWENFHHVYAKSMSVLSSIEHHGNLPELRAPRNVAAITEIEDPDALDEMWMQYVSLKADVQRHAEALDLKSLRKTLAAWQSQNKRLLQMLHGQMGNVIAELAPRELTKAHPAVPGAAAPQDSNRMQADRSRPPEKVEPSPVSDSTLQP